MISIVDDDESVRTATKALLRSVGYEVETFASAELFLESGALRETKCLVLDVRMPGIDGMEMQRRLNEAKSRVPIIFVSAHDHSAQREKAIEAGAANFFRKPFDATAFLAAIQAALRRRTTLDCVRFQKGGFSMSAQGSILTDPHPCRHIVYPFTDEEKGVNAVYLFASSGLSKGESVILIMADSRCKPVMGRLANGGFDISALQTSGQLKCIGADSMLRTFMRSGLLNEQLVRETIGRIIDRARLSSPNRKVRVFGEMVSLLLARKELAVAERLEELWNGIIEAHSISLLCTYALLDSELTMLPDSLIKLHSHTLGARPLGWDSMAERASGND
jgi:CheY-like chemotaxis protein